MSSDWRCVPVLAKIRARWVRPELSVRPQVRDAPCTVKPCIKAVAKETSDCVRSKRISSTEVDGDADDALSVVTAMSISLGYPALRRKGARGAIAG
jgi:hypothetical protein